MSARQLAVVFALALGGLAGCDEQPSPARPNDGSVTDRWGGSDSDAPGDAGAGDAINPNADSGANPGGDGAGPDDGTAMADGAPAADAQPVGPSGEPMPAGDLPGWKLVFTDDFTTPVPLGSFPSAVSTKWSAYPDGWKDTSKNGTYMPSKVVSIAGGVMDLYLHTEGGVHMVSAPVPKIPGAQGSGGGLLYGRYAIRFKADPVPGYKTAWLLWPDSESWPEDGEIDFPEGDLDDTICAFMHRQNGTSGGDQDAFCTQETYTSWHTAITEWSASEVRFLLDGKTVGTSTSRIPNTPMHWVIQTETALSGGAPSDSAEGHVQIDWVAVWVPK